MLLNNFYPLISYRRVRKKKKATNYCIRLGHSLRSAISCQRKCKLSKAVQCQWLKNTYVSNNGTLSVFTIARYDADFPYRSHLINGLRIDKEFGYRLDWTVAMTTENLFLKETKDFNTCGFTVIKLVTLI